MVSGVVSVYSSVIVISSAGMRSAAVSSGAGAGWGISTGSGCAIKTSAGAGAGVFHHRCGLLPGGRGLAARLRSNLARCVAIRASLSFGWSSHHELPYAALQHKESNSFCQALFVQCNINEIWCGKARKRGVAGASAGLYIAPRCRLQRLKSTFSGDSRALDGNGAAVLRL